MANINRRGVLIWAGGGIAIAALHGMAHADRATAKQPNILYIFVDDLSHRAVGCYAEAHDWVHTPKIDRLAKEGVRFTTCYTGAWCAPSRGRRR